MSNALASELGDAVALLGSPRDDEVLAAARAIGRTLETAGMDWNSLGTLVRAEVARRSGPAFTFATAGGRTARKLMAHLARQPGTTPEDALRLKHLRIYLIGARKLTLTAQDIAWLDGLWRAAHGESGG